MNFYLFVHVGRFSLIFTLCDGAFLCGVVCERISYLKDIWEVYKDIWEVSIREELPCQHESGNRADPFAVVVVVGGKCRGWKIS